MKLGRREANEVHAGGQGTIGFQPGVSAKIGMEMAPNIQNTELVALSKTALKSPLSIVGTDGSAKSRHDVNNNNNNNSLY